MTDQEKRTAMAQYLWLTHFNQTLYACGVITEAERNQMCRKITARHPLPANRAGEEFGHVKT